jgi:hypothetical protein
LAGFVFDDVVRADSVGVPFGPPLCGDVGFGAVGGVTGIEVAEVESAGTITLVMRGGGIQVNRGKIPAAAEST